MDEFYQLCRKRLTLLLFSERPLSTFYLGNNLLISLPKNVSRIFITRRLKPEGERSLFPLASYHSVSPFWNFHFSDSSRTIYQEHFR